LDPFQGLQGGFAFKIRLANFGRDRRQADRTQDLSEQQG
jgi:hypothetical protein